jgi:hypothetical protein
LISVDEYAVISWPPLQNMTEKTPNCVNYERPKKKPALIYATLDASKPGYKNSLYFSTILSS